MIGATSTTVLLAAASLVSAVAYYPSPIKPDSTTVWYIGSTAGVAWDVNKVPADADPIPYVELFNTTSYGGASYVVTLAENFDAQQGHVDFTVPDVTPGSYFVDLGSWGQSSQHFQISGDPQPVNYLPSILTPDSTTVWTRGQQASVTWNATSIPAGAVPATLWVDLYNSTSYGSAWDQARLADNVDVHAGSVSFTVPTTISPGSYFIMLGGYAHDSEAFKIE